MSISIKAIFHAAKNMRLSVKLALLISVFALLSALGTALWVYDSVSHSAEKTIRADQLESGSQTMDKIDRLMDARLDQLRIASHADQLVDVLENGQQADEARADLLALRASDSDWNGLTLIDTHSNAVVTSDADDLGNAFMKLNSSFPDLYEKALSGQVVYSNVIKLPDDKNPTVVVMVPVTDDAHQHNVGVLAGEVNWAAVTEILKHVNGGGDVTLVTASGLEIGTNQADQTSNLLRANWSHTDLFRHAITDSGNGTITSTSLDNPNQTVLASYVREAGFGSFPGDHWLTLIFTSQATAFAPARELAIHIVIGLMILSLVMLVATVAFVTRFITMPIRRLVQLVKNITLGDLNGRITVTGRDEVGELGVAFNDMVSQLAVANASLARQTARLQASINSLPLGFMLTDTKNAILGINPVMRKYIGLNADFDLSDTSAKAFPDNLKFLQQLLDNCQRCLDKGSTISLSAASFNNRIFHLLFSPVIEDGEVIGVVSIGEDVTEAKILERSKDEFFSIASHELRTPLTAIEGNASLIEQFYKEQLKDESLRSMVSDIKSSSIRLIGIVNDFLDVSRLEQGKMKFRPEPIGTETVIESVVYELSAVSREKQIRVVTTNTLAKLPPVYADQDRLKQVLYNLAGNALKFTDKGQVTFTAKVTGRTMTVYVNDTGRGISPENQQLLFHKFQQANDSLLTRDTTRGTGLGLYISKLIVEHMGGHLRLINSEIGVGSTFAFTVPLAKTKSATSRH